MNTFSDSKLQNHSIELNISFLPIWSGSLKLIGPHANNDATGFEHHLGPNLTDLRRTVLYLPHPWK